MAIGPVGRGVQRGDSRAGQARGNHGHADPLRGLARGADGHEVGAGLQGRRVPHGLLAIKDHEMARGGIVDGEGRKRSGDGRSRRRTRQQDEQGVNSRWPR